MAQVLITQPEFAQKSPLEIYNSIQREGFADFILHSPKIECQPVPTRELGDISNVVTFGYGSNNIIGIKNSLELTHFKFGGKEAIKVQPGDVTPKQKPGESSIVEALNPLAIIARLGVEKRQSKNIYNITKFQINKEGTFGLVIADDACFAILAEIGEIRMLDKEQVGRVIAVSIVESAQSTDNKYQVYEFFLANNKGGLKYGTVIITDVGPKRTENSVNVRIQSFPDFKTAEGQNMSVNGVFAVESSLTGGNKRNHLFVSVDKKLFHMQNTSTFENFVKNPNQYLQQKKVVLESGNIENSLYASTLFNNEIITLYMVETVGIRSVIINTSDDTQLREDLPIFDAQGKLAIRVDPKLKGFHVSAYHYVMVFESSLVVINSIVKEVRFRQTFDQPIKSVFKNMKNGNLMIFLGTKIYELAIMNELVGSWIHLVERGMEEVAYTTCENFDPMYEVRSAGLLARKLFQQKRFVAGAEKLFQNSEDFESVIWKFYSFRSDSNEFFKSIIKYCSLLLEDLLENKDESLKMLISLKTKILLHFMVECLSYKFVQIKRLLDVKSKDGKAFHTNVTVDDSILSFYETNLKKLLQDHSKKLDADVVKEIFQSHGNFLFANEFETLIKDYNGIIFDFVCFDNFSMAVKNLKAYMDELLSDPNRSSKNFKEISQPFVTLLEKFGIDFQMRTGAEFLKIVERLMAPDCIVLFDERLFTSGFLCLQSAWQKPELWKGLTASIVNSLGKCPQILEKRKKRY